MMRIEAEAEAESASVMFVISGFGTHLLHCGVAVLGHARLADGQQRGDADSGHIEAMRASMSAVLTRLSGCGWVPVMPQLAGLHLRDGQAQTGRWRGWPFALSGRALTTSTAKRTSESVPLQCLLNALQFLFHRLQFLQ